MEHLSHILNTASVQRLRGILQSRYGTGLEVEFIADTRSADMTSQTPSLSEGELRIPIISEGRFLAKAILPTAQNINADDFETIGDLVQMVLEPLIQRWMESVTAGEQTQIEKQHDNVVHLFRHDSEKSEGQTVRSLLTSIIYLETTQPVRLPKVIAEIHEISRRWARIDFEQIAHNIKTVHDIQSLGALTLVVNDVLNLSPDQLAVLVNYVKSKPTEEMPLILVSSRSSMKSLISQEMISPETAEVLQQCILEVDRLPQKSDLLRETLELFLEPGAIL